MSDPRHHPGIGDSLIKLFLAGNSSGILRFLEIFRSWSGKKPFRQKYFRPGRVNPANAEVFPPGRANLPNAEVFPARKSKPSAEVFPARRVNPHKAEKFPAKEFNQCWNF